MSELTGIAADAATIFFNLPDYRVISSAVIAGRRQVNIETDQLPGCPSCGVIASRWKERRPQRLRDIPVAGPVDVLWSKYRCYCEEVACDRLSFFESTPQVPRRARSTARLRDQLVEAVIRLGRAVSETAAGFAVSWWMVRAAVTEACLLRLPDVDKLSHGCWALMRTGSGLCAAFRTRQRKRRHRAGPGRGRRPRSHEWRGLAVARPLEWRLAGQVVAVDPSAAFRMWLPGTAVAVDHFQLSSLANLVVTETRQNLSQQIKGRRGRAIDKA